MGRIYGYCRISTKQQSIERQVRNIKAVHPDAIIVKEVYTGTKFQGRKELDRILRHVQEGDMIVFDSVSRMSRNAEEGFELYERLFQTGIELEFLKEPHINTAVYRAALENTVRLTGTDVDYILEGVNRYLLAVAKAQIKIAFEQAEKEVADLHQRTKEGMETARLQGKQIGLKKGTTLVTQKSIEAKKKIRQHSVDCGGSLKDKDLIALTGVSRNSFYKYKREILESLAEGKDC